MLNLALYYMYKTILILLLIIGYHRASAQGCVTHGQTPATAFPVCGTKNFVQETVPICANGAVPGCGTSDTNPFWYKFTCFKSGTLGFLIKPKTAVEDYDWQLFDITGHQPNDVYTKPELTVAANWAGTYGNTGTSSTGVTYTQCGSNPAENKPTFAAMPNIVEGHTYLLLVSNYTAVQSGYSLSFNGGTASITDLVPPTLLSAAADCEGAAVKVVLSKKMKCATLAADGSDFNINAPGVKVIAARAATCASGFDMDTLILTLSKALLPGNYALQIKTGSDNNTILDYCDNGIPAGTTLPLGVLEKQPTPMDSLTAPACASQSLQLVFSKPIRCSSIAADGSDFSITGPAPVVIAGAEGVCNETLSNSILIRLSAPMVQGGQYVITMKNGTDGNTILDECGQVTPAGSALSFGVKDTVSAYFDATLLYGCTWDTIQVAHDGKNGVNQWSWTFEDNFIRTTPSAQVAYNTYGNKKVQLVVSNGFCTDTAVTTLLLDNELKAGINGPTVACPLDPVTFTDTCTGNIVAYQWNFGTPVWYPQQTPPVQFYTQSAIDRTYTVSLVVQNNHQCYDTAVHTIKIPFTCNISVPTAFTPNGDGRNDYLYPLNAYKAKNVDFRIYNRYGQLVFRTADWQKKWDGTLNGKPAATDTYVWVFSYTHQDTGKAYVLKGTSVLMR